MIMGILALVVIAVLAVQWFQLYQLRAEREKMTELKVSQQELVTEIQEEQRREEQLRNRAAIILGALESPQWGELLSDLSEVTPEGVWLESLQFTPGTPRLIEETVPTEETVLVDNRYDYGEIRFSGSSSNAYEVSAFIQRLSLNSHFEEVTPVVTESGGAGNASFTIVARLIY